MIKEVTWGLGKVSSTIRIYLSPGNERTRGFLFLEQCNLAERACNSTLKNEGAAYRMNAGDRKYKW